MRHTRTWRFVDRDDLALKLMRRVRRLGYISWYEAKETYTVVYAVKEYELD